VFYFFVAVDRLDGDEGSQHMRNKKNSRSIS